MRLYYWTLSSRLLSQFVLKRFILRGTLNVNQMPWVEECAGGASLLNALISRCTDVHVQCVRNMRVDPSVYLSIICLSICLSSVSLSIYLNRYQIYIDLFIICPSFFLSVCTVYQSVHPFIHLSIYLLVCLFVCLSHGQISR